MGLFFLYFLFWAAIGFVGTLFVTPLLSPLVSAFVGWVAAQCILDAGSPGRTGRALLIPLCGAMTGMVPLYLFFTWGLEGRWHIPLWYFIGGNMIAFFAANAYTLWRSPQGRGYRPPKAA